MSHLTPEAAHSPDQAPQAPEASGPSAWLLPLLMLVGASGGAVVGTVFGPGWSDASFEPWVLTFRLSGTVFLNLLKALVIPLVVTSVITGITRMGDLRKVGKTAAGTLFFFMSTTFIAVFTGIVLVNLIQPGSAGSVENLASLSATQAERANVGALEAAYEVIAGMFPPNLFAAATEGNILGLIVFSLFFGGVLTLEGKRGRGLIEMIDVANEALMKLVRLVIWVAPLGIFGLVADRIGMAGGGAAVWSEILRLGWYAATVMVGLIFHGAVTLPLILRLVGRRKPARYAMNMGDSFLTAVGTASSAATMAVTLRCVVEKNQVSRRAADFVIPLGTTINMDGTALYEAVAVMFIAQSLGIELSFAQQVVVLFTATLAAIGAAAIPEAGLVTMVIVLTAVGLPVEGIGLILSIDWILDRFRTGINVWGDAVGAAVIDRFLPPEEAAGALEAS